MIKQWLAVLAQWDKQVSAWVAQTSATDQRDWSYWLALLGAHLGDTWLWVLVALLEWRRPDTNQRRITVVLPWLCSLGAAIGVTLLIKQRVKRPRPGTGALLYGPGADEHSFPSGHALRMGVIALWGDTLWPGRGWLVRLLALWVGWSRVRLGVHYVGDVLVGLALGGLLAALTQRLGTLVRLDQQR